MPVFHVRQGLTAGAEVDLPLRQITIGRSSHNTLVLPDESVDLMHASLEQRGGRWVLQDLGAPGGTRLNDMPIDKPRCVFDGDVIMFGKIRVEVQGVGGPDEGVDDPLSELEAPEVIIQSIQSPAITRAALKRRLYILSVIAGLATAVVIIVLFLLRETLFETIKGWQTNEPPVLNLLLTEREITISPEEEVVFFTEVEDPEDLDRVEFWVNDVLQAVKKPLDADVVKMRTRHQWSTNQPETYILSFIAYDKIGQSSEMIKVLVKVEKP